MANENGNVDSQLSDIQWISTDGFLRMIFYLKYRRLVG